jgi:hypothetical protein
VASLKFGPLRTRLADRVGGTVSKQALGNVLAGVLFFIAAIVNFTRDDSGIGVVFLVFAAVFLGLGLSARRAHA